MNRRKVLLGLSGLTVSLPWLEAIADVKKSKTLPPRVAFLFMPNGVNQKLWTPSTVGRDYEISEILKPLKANKSDFDVLTNLKHARAQGGDGHYAKTSNFLSGELVRKTSGRDLYCGVSADQVLARQYGDLTPLPSIELGVEPTRTRVDTNVGFTQVYGGHISWSSARTPLPKEIYPQLAFDRLFNAGRKGENLQSVLDDIREDAKELDKYLGVEDRRRMDEFFTSLRSLEKRIQRAVKEDQQNKIIIPDKQRPEAGLPQNLETHMRLMLDIIVLAFKMRRTNVATFMFGNAVSGRNFSFLDGVDGGFHQLSHHAGNQEKLKMYGLINVFHMKMFNEMILKMKNIKEGDKTLLDNSLVMIGSGLRDGNSHSPVNLPILIAGRGGKNLQRGEHRLLPKNTPLCNLLLGMMQTAGLGIEKFGDSKNSII
jgi:hypothetical protein